MITDDKLDKKIQDVSFVLETLSNSVPEIKRVKVLNQTIMQIEFYYGKLLAYKEIRGY